MTAPGGVPVAFEVTDLRVRRGRRTILDVPSLVVPEGAVLAVLGPNGAGKSTLLQAAALLIRPTTGAVRLLGEVASGHGARMRLRRRAAVMFQRPGLLDMTARANVETALRLHGVPGPERARRARRWLERLGVAHLAEARAHTLSGGEAQRVSMARAFAVEPQVLFLDEPFGSLDPPTTSRLVGELRELLSAEGLTTILSTHDVSEARLLAGRTLVLLDGKPAQIGETDEVLDAPASAAVAEFLGYAVVPARLHEAAQDGEAVHTLELGRLRSVTAGNMLPSGRGVTAGDVLPSGPGQRPATAGPLTVAVPPAAVRLLDGETPAGSGCEGVIVAVEGGVGRVRVVVDVGVPLVAQIAAEDRRLPALRPGDACRVAVDAARVVVLPDAG